MRYATFFITHYKPPHDGGCSGYAKCIHYATDTEAITAAKEYVEQGDPQQGSVVVNMNWKTIWKSDPNELCPNEIEDGPDTYSKTEVENE